MYRNKSEKGVEGGLNIHYGSTMLDVDFDDLTHLSGTYWNDRTYIGTLELTKKSNERWDQLDAQNRSNMNKLKLQFWGTIIAALVTYIIAIIKLG